VLFRLALSRAEASGRHSEVMDAGLSEVEVGDRDRERSARRTFPGSRGRGTCDRAKALTSGEARTVGAKRKKDARNTWQRVYKCRWRILSLITATPTAMLWISAR
jgi:hypothetical protein